MILQWDRVGVIFRKITFTQIVGIGASNEKLGDCYIGPGKR